MTRYSIGRWPTLVHRCCMFSVFDKRFKTLQSTPNLGQTWSVAMKKVYMFGIQGKFLFASVKAPEVGKGAISVPMPAALFVAPPAFAACPHLCLVQVRVVISLQPMTSLHVCRSHCCRVWFSCNLFCHAFPPNFCLFPATRDFLFQKSADRGTTWSNMKEHVYGFGIQGKFLFCSVLKVSFRRQWCARARRIFTHISIWCM